MAQKNFALESRSWQPVVDCFATMLTLVQNFLATGLVFIDILQVQSLVVYVNHHNKDYLRKTPCDWLCGDDAAFVKLLLPLV